MPWSRPNSSSRSSRSSLDAVASTVAPARLASWIAARPTPPAAGLDQHGLAGLQAPELEQAVVGGAEGDRDPRAPPRSSMPSGIGPADCAGTDAQLGVGAAEAHRRHDALADAEAGRPPRRPVRIVPAAWYPTMCGFVASQSAGAVQQCHRPRC